MGGYWSARPLGLPEWRLRSSGKSNIHGNYRFHKAARRKPSRKYLRLRGAGGPLGRSGHHLGTGGGAEPTGSDRAGHRCRHEPRIVSEPRPRRAAQPRSCLWGCMLAEVVWPWSELRGAPHIRVPLPLTPPTSGSCPSPRDPQDPGSTPRVL